MGANTPKDNDKKLSPEQVRTLDLLIKKLRKASDDARKHIAEEEASDTTQSVVPESSKDPYKIRVMQVAIQVATTPGANISDSSLKFHVAEILKSLNEEGFLVLPKGTMPLEEGIITDLKEAIAFVRGEG